MENVRRIYVEKKTGYAVKAQELKEDLIGYLNMSGIEDVRMFIRYDVENISDEVFEQACRTVFSEPPVDILYRETIEIPATDAYSALNICRDSLTSVQILPYSAFSF